MFWYRPAALEPLFRLQLSPDEIPPEPVPNNGTILHCIERMLVYIAWSAGYDYRIMVPETPQFSAFTDNMRLNKKLKEIKDSKSYRIGRYILTIPRTIKDWLNKI
jgi:rhamnosyltransferase